LHGCPLNLRCFKTFDVRGKVGADLDEDMAFRIGHAVARVLNAKRIALGGDARLSTPMLKAAAAEGAMAAGCDVVDLGLTGTEEVYFASFHLNIDGGMEVTASHGPAAHNGFKFIARGGRPLSTAEFQAIKASTANPDAMPKAKGRYSQSSVLEPYARHLLSCVDVAAIQPLRIVADAGHGAAGHVIDALEPHLPVSFIKANHEPDGHFPNGVPNPLIPENRAQTRGLVRDSGADLGIAWDGDFDRCFLYDARGAFVSSYYLTGLLTALFLIRAPGERFIVDARLNWDTFDRIHSGAGHGMLSRAGHSFFKAAMRREQAVYGGEVSGHHYFRDFAHCDSGMLPWLLTLEYLGRVGSSLHDAVAPRLAKFPSSEEINFDVDDPQSAIAAITAHYRPQAANMDATDGVTLELGRVRLNLRASNTESLLRLNVESRGDPQAVDDCVAEVRRLLAQGPDGPSRNSL
jgi:phosphomannomutase